MRPGWAHRAVETEWRSHGDSAAISSSTSGIHEYWTGSASARRTTWVSNDLHVAANPTWRPSERCSSTLRSPSNYVYEVWFGISGPRSILMCSGTSLCGIMSPVLNGGGRVFGLNTGSPLRIAVRVDLLSSIAVLSCLEPRAGSAHFVHAPRICRRTVCSIAGMLSQPIPKSLEIYSSFELKKMNANIAALAMVLRLDLPRVEVPSDSYRDHSAARQTIEGRMTNDDRTCGTAAAGPQAEAFEGHGPRLRTALTCTARADAGMLATERRRTELADDRHRSSATLQADDPSMPAVQSQAEIHTSSRHRAERRKSHANRLGPRPRRAHSVSSRNQYGRIELRGAASSVSA